MSDANIVGLVVYAFIVGIILENLYEVLKLFIKKDLDEEEFLADGQVIKKKVDTKIKRLFCVSCVFVSITFWPYTIFYWLEFEPTGLAINDYAIFHILYSAMFVGMTASTIYNTVKRVKAFLPGLIGRVRPKLPH